MVRGLVANAHSRIFPRIWHELSTYCPITSCVIVKGSVDFSYSAKHLPPYLYEEGGRTPMGVDQIVERLALEPGELILEVGLDSDCDNEFRSAIEKRTGTKFIEDATTEVVDAVLLWWRDGDGDLVDDLMDGLTYLTETGPIWLLTPKVNRDGHVEPSDIQEAAPIAGLAQTVSFAIGNDWTATKLVARKASRK
jgi:hypothetical protein